MIDMRFRPVLMTSNYVKNNSFANTEWFGVEWPYVPYWDAEDEHYAYGYHNGEGVILEIGAHTEFFVVFREGEFLCSLEMDRIVPPNTKMFIKTGELAESG